MRWAAGLLPAAAALCPAGLALWSAAAASVLAAGELAPAAAGVPADSSFLLTATSDDLPTYFPSYLANGYLSTMTAPRGTESNLAYMVAFMDYAKDDIARPAAIPGWSGLNYSTGKSTSGQFWLNDVKLGPKAFEHYSQTLNMHDGTLTTSYRYTDASAKSTQIEVVTFVSQAATHLAATRIAITPEFSGTVQLSFPISLWAPHQPRFPIRKMNGDEMLEAVAANNMTVLEPVNHVTPDRAPVWYHGDTHVRDKGAQKGDLTLWLNGRAEEGLTMAEAAAIGIPSDLKSTDVTVVDTQYQLGLLLSVPVEKGKTYTFTKYVAVSRQGWGGDAQETLSLAKAARRDGFEQLLNAHRAAWNELWKSDIVIDGNAKAQNHEVRAKVKAV